jgi:hypothetical protein
MTDPAAAFAHGYPQSTADSHAQIQERQGFANLADMRQALDRQARRIAELEQIEVESANRLERSFQDIRRFRLRAEAAERIVDEIRRLHKSHGITAHGLWAGVTQALQGVES